MGKKGERVPKNGEGRGNAAKELEEREKAQALE